MKVRDGWLSALPLARSVSSESAEAALPEEETKRLDVGDRAFSRRPDSDRLREAAEPEADAPAELAELGCEYC